VGAVWALVLVLVLVVMWIQPKLNTPVSVNRCQTAAAVAALQAKYREALAAGLDGESRVDAAFGLVSAMHPLPTKRPWLYVYVDLPHFHKREQG
jgi:hypothetical protein